MVRRRYETVVPEFMSKARIQVYIPGNPSVLDYFNIFTMADFYNLLVEQTNLIC